ncbi:MAG: hypothetical protein M0Z67_00675 [Nitrospiraceae bacterium]|nr:hypothetical protein [Nitrospiraceae bacterium]
MLRAIFFAVFAVLVSLAIQPVVFAEEGNVTPYGDYCQGCTSYGTCKEVITPRDAVIALDRYYRDRGYRVGTIYHKGRFIEAEIFKNNREVDKVLFDRKTGRLRSIY